MEAGRCFGADFVCQTHLWVPGSAVLVMATPSEAYFFGAHPALRSNAFFVFGESYAGHYVPNVAHRVWVGNGAGGAPHINLVGMSVGNGLTDPEVQYAYYPAMAVSTNQHQPAVSNATYEKMAKAVPGCIKAIRRCNGGEGVVSKLACVAAYETCNAALTAPYQLTGMNP